MDYVDSGTCSDCTDWETLVDDRITQVLGTDDVKVIVTGVS